MFYFKEKCCNIEYRWVQYLESKDYHLTTLKIIKENQVCTFLTRFKGYPSQIIIFGRIQHHTSTRPLYLVFSGYTHLFNQQFKTVCVFCIGLLVHGSQRSRKKERKNSRVQFTLLLFHKPSPTYKNYKVESFRIHT